MIPTQAFTLVDIDTNGELLLTRGVRQGQGHQRGWLIAVFCHQIIISDFDSTTSCVKSVATRVLQGMTYMAS